ncbi:hypothetical protein GmHk_11G032855 [Glycine max]|nr:hypothetical protein GmHk_11G032855 [Glycine max]
MSCTDLQRLELEAGADLRASDEFVSDCEIIEASWYGKLNPLLDLPCRAELSCFHEESGCDNLVEYVCLNAILVEFSLTRGICRRCLIRIRLNYHEESGFSILGDTIRTHEHC